MVEAVRPGEGAPLDPFVATAALELTLGVVLPLSGSAAIFGEEALRGVRLATGALGDVGGGSGPRLLIRDTAGKPSEASAAVRELAAVPGLLAILGPLCDALALAHDRGIVHRDLTSTNVFLADGRDHGRVVLLDFGIAKPLRWRDSGVGSVSGAGVKAYPNPPAAVSPRAAVAAEAVSHMTMLLPAGSGNRLVWRTRGTRLTLEDVQCARASDFFRGAHFLRALQGDA